MNFTKKKLESFLPSDETLRERKQEWEHLFSHFDADDEIDAIDFKDVGTNISSEEEGDKSSTEIEECKSESDSEVESEISRSEMEELKEALRPIIKKRIKKWERNSEFEWSEEIVMKDGARKSIRKSVKNSASHFVELADISNPSESSIKTSLCEPFDHQFRQYENGDRYYRKITRTTKVEEIIQYETSDYQIAPQQTPKSKKSIKHKNNESWDSVQTPKRTTPEKAKTNYPTIKGPEIVAYIPKSTAGRCEEVKIVAKKIQNNIIKQGINDVLIESDITVRRNHQLILTPGAKDKDVNSIIKNDSKKDIFKRLSCLKRATIKEIPIESIE